MLRINGALFMIPLFGLFTHEGAAGYVILGNALSTPTVLLMVLVASLAAGISYVTTYVSFDRAGTARALVVMNTYTIFSVPIGLLFAALGFHLTVLPDL